MKAHDETSPFKSITQEHVDLLYNQICSIPNEYKKIKDGSRNPAKKMVTSVLGVMKTSGVDKQKEAEDLVLKATKIYMKGSSTNPDLWQHEEKQKAVAKPVTTSDNASEAVLITHTKNTMFDARPVKSLQELQDAIQQLEQLPSRSGIQERQLGILNKQYKICLSEQRLVSQEEIDRYAALAMKYAELLNLLDLEFEKARREKGTPVTKKESGYRGKEYKTIAAMEISELIQYLNVNHKDHHLLRMISAILKERFSDENRYLLSGIAFHDQTNVYDRSAFARRKPFTELVVPDTYELGLSKKTQQKKI